MAQAYGSSVRFGPAGSRDFVRQLWIKSSIYDRRPVDFGLSSAAGGRTGFGLIKKPRLFPLGCGLGSPERTAYMKVLRSATSSPVWRQDGPGELSMGATA